MRINVKQPVLDCEGRPLMVNQTNADGTPVIGEDHRPVQVPETLRNYLVLALNNKAQTETEPIGAEEAAKRYQPSTKPDAGNDVELTHAECTSQERIAAICDSLLIVGRVGDLLEGRTIEVPDAAAV